MGIRRVLLLGGSGFIGTAVAEHLAARGIEVTVPSRRRERARHLLVLPTVEVLTADVHDEATLAALSRGQDAVINLVGILHGDFERVHVELPRKVAAAALRAQVPRLIHMSALNADEQGPSEYLRSRGRGEAAVQGAAQGARSGLAVTVFRPSVVFGARDRFLNLFADLIDAFPVIPLGSADARFQPVWVEDVARAIVAALDDPSTAGATYALVGPRQYTPAELVAWVAAQRGKRRWIVPLPAPLAMLQAAVFERLPGRLITRDNVRSMRLPNVSATPMDPRFGRAHALEAEAPAWLAAGRPRYDAFRGHAGRPT